MEHLGGVGQSLNCIRHELSEHKNGKPERNTTPFVNSELVAFEHRQRFGPGDIDKYTVVMWLEGTDIDCTDNLLGGEIKVHMEFNSEFKEVDASKFERKLD